jgi:hypothetical protein
VGCLEIMSKMLLVIRGKTFLLTERTRINREIPKSLPQKGLAILKTRIKLFLEVTSKFNHV